MGEIIIIAAVAENNVIGNKGKIPWYISEDFRHFKELTLGWPCIMGDVTFESLPIKPLPDRENIILTFNKDYHPEGAKVFYSFGDALEYCKDKEKVFICGGASIYKQAMEFADKLEMTVVHHNPDGDTYFPDVDFNIWELVSDDPHEDFTFLTCVRKNGQK